MASGSLCLARKAALVLKLTTCRERTLHSPIVCSSIWQPLQSSSSKIPAQQCRGKSIVGQSNCPEKLFPFPHFPQRATGMARGTVGDFAPFFNGEANQQSCGGKEQPDWREPRPHFLLGAGQSLTMETGGNHPLIFSWELVGH